MNQSQQRAALETGYADSNTRTDERATQNNKVIQLPPRPVHPQANVLGLEDAIDEYISSMHGILSPATIKWYEPRLKSLKKYFGNVSVPDIQTSDLRKWRDTLTNRSSRWDNHPSRPTQEGGLSRWTLHGYVRAVRAFFKWLFEEEKIEKNPAQRLQLPQLPDEPPKKISAEDMLRIFKTAESNPRDYALVRFLASTGARVGGVAGLMWEDISLETERATVREKGKGGKGKSRTVYFKKKTAEALAKWKEISGVSNGPVFPSQRGGGLSEAGVYQVLERLAKQAGVVGRWNPHSFRHAHAIDLLEHGASLAHVSQILGHKDPQITIRFYARFADKELKEANDRYSSVE